MDAMLGAIAFDTTTERTQRFTLDAIMNANNLAFFVEFFTGFYSQRPSVSNVRNREVADCLDRRAGQEGLLDGHTQHKRARGGEKPKIFGFYDRSLLFSVFQTHLRSVPHVKKWSDIFRPCLETTSLFTKTYIWLMIKLKKN